MDRFIKSGDYEMYVNKIEMGLKIILTVDKTSKTILFQK